MGAMLTLRGAMLAFPSFLGIRAAQLFEHVFPYPLMRSANRAIKDRPQTWQDTGIRL